MSIPRTWRGSIKIVGEKSRLRSKPLNGRHAPHGQFLMFCAHPEAIRYRTKNPYPTRGVPRRNQKARHLNFVNPKTTIAIHAKVSAILSLGAPKKKTKESAAMTSEVANADAKLRTTFTRRIVALHWSAAKLQVRNGSCWRERRPGIPEGVPGFPASVLVHLGGEID